MIYLQVMVETTVISLTGIILGFGLGLIISYNLVHDIAAQPSWSGVEFSIPWRDLVVIFLSVYVVSLLTALLPARRAASVYPAEALRYD